MTAAGKTTEQGLTPWEKAALDLLRIACPDSGTRPLEVDRDLNRAAGFDCTTRIRKTP